MQFKHPELLYALFFLIIPILVHLFQLRKFRKTPFTNVKFLREVTLQTRKSSQLKKWLVLATRLLALACIIFAFAQPFSASETALSTEKETVIYLDNSFSMQARGNQGELLQRAAQQLFENPEIPEELNWFTNSDTYKNTFRDDFKNEVLQVDYTSSKLSFNEVILQAENLFTNRPNTEKNLIWISDFHGSGNFPELSDKDFNVSTVQLNPAARNNIAIDSLYISSAASNMLELTVLFSSYGDNPESVPVSLYKDEVLTLRSSVDFIDAQTASVIFEIEDESGFSGRVSITDQSLLFDNDLYFNINDRDNIKVLAINNERDEFLRKIFTSDEFELISQPLGQLDYNILPEQHTIILNELESIPTALQTALLTFSENGGTLIIIPSTSVSSETYNPFLNNLNFGSISGPVTAEKQITTIQFSHPIYRNVFEDRVSNFQYPRVNSYYNFSRNNIPVLSFEDGSGFLVQSGNHYLFNSSIKTENSNFKNSPLIVPTFYSIAKRSLPLPDLYYTIGEQNEFAIPIQLSQETILNIRNEQVDFIPLQKNTANKVTLTTTDDPATAGIYGIFSKQEEIAKVSFNYSREESNPTYMDANNWAGTENFNAINSLFDKIAKDNTISEYWKWFVIFALFFLAIEMFLLKLIK